MIPHRWEDCFPVLIDPRTGEFDLNDERNCLVRKLFELRLTGSERRLFHEACCHKMRTERHLTLIAKVIQLVKTIEN